MGDVVRLDEHRRTSEEREGAPPAHDLEAEAALVSAAMLVPYGDTDAAKEQRNRLDRVHDLVGCEALFDPGLGRVWEAIEYLRASNTPVDLHTVHARLADRGLLEKVGGRERLADLVEHAQAPGNVEAHAKRVKDLHELREIAATCLRVQAEARALIGEHEETKARWRRDLGRVTAPRQGLAGRSIGAVGAVVRKRVEEGMTRLVGVRYGLRALEEAFGLLARGRQHVLAGRSEHGKTALACEIAWNVADTPLDADGVGEAVYMLSGEMPAETLLFRSACSLAGVDAQRLECGFADPEEREKFGTWLGWLRSLPVIIDDKPGTPADIARRVKGRQAEFASGAARREDRELFPKCRMQLVIGDNLQELATLAPPLGARDDLLRQIGATALGWRDEIAKGCNVATLLLSQLTRAIADPKGKKRWPVASDLWGGTPIEASADTIIGLQRPEVFGGKVPEQWRGVAGVVPMKGRMGGTRRVIRLGFSKGVFSDDLPPGARGEAHYEDDES